MFRRVAVVTCAAATTLLGAVVLPAAVVRQSDSGDSVVVQSPPSDQHGYANLAAAVRGSDTPELVPDRVAYRHFVLSLARHSNPSAAEIATRKILLEPVGLSETDAVALVHAIEGVREQVEAFELTRRALASSAAQVKLAKEKEDAVLTLAKERVMGALSPLGVLTVTEYVQNTVKRRITIYGTVIP